jgi:hypothetical protein
MKKCYYCGVEIEDDADFCTACGSELPDCTCPSVVQMLGMMIITARTVATTF